MVTMRTIYDERMNMHVVRASVWKKEREETDNEREIFDNKDVGKI